MKTNRPTTTLPAQLSVPVDVLLADVAIRIQLNRSDYKKAVNRYQVISEWIERNGSPLENRVDLFYPQGSMATGSTIASKLRTDEFDIDIAAQIQFPRDVTAQCALESPVRGNTRRTRLQILWDDEATNTMRDRQLPRQHAS